jgi:glycosyltransferase involved in cell wall biosynthesis
MAAMNVLVLLSTFNGSAFLREQIRSILDQRVEGKLTLLVRDDGSQDDTIAILQSFREPRLEITRGENLGAKASYLELLATARQRDADYIALSDQDDVWLEGKLERAIDQLRAIDGPALYCSAVNLVDANLNPQARFAYSGAPGFEIAFFTNCVTGCTCVINRAVALRLKEFPRPDEILMHDWWLYLVVVAFGQVIYDSESRILYRQHGANQIGRARGALGFAARAGKFRRRPPRPHRLTQAREFHRLYGSSLTAAQSAYLDELLGCEGRLFARLRFAWHLRTASGLDEMIGIMSFMFAG